MGYSEASSFSCILAIAASTLTLQQKLYKMAKAKKSGEECPAEAAGEEKFTFFFGAESPFSQWHAASFAVDGVDYNCAEQYMMYQKAGKSGLLTKNWGFSCLASCLQAARTAPRPSELGNSRACSTSKTCSYPNTHALHSSVQG